MSAALPMLSLLPRFVKDGGKMALRAIVRRRLDWWPLDIEQADAWAECFKRWPAIFGSLRYTRRRQVGVDMVMDLGLIDVVERNLFVNGGWDPAVRGVFEAYLRSGDVCVDVGANIGYFTLLASRLVGKGGRVVACEPSIRALCKLTHHLMLNQCRNVQVLSMGLSDRKCVEDLCWGPESNIGASSVRGDAMFHGCQERVLLYPLDDIVRCLKVRPKLVKIDVEGHEAHVLRGAAATLKACRPAVICELTEAFLQARGSTARQLVAFMEDLGYRSFLLQTSLDGRIQCRSCGSGDAWLPSNQAEVLFTSGEPCFPLVP